MGVVWEPVDPVTAAPPPQLCDVGRSEARALEDEHHVDGPCTQARRQPRGEGPSQQGVPPSAPLLAAAHLTSQPLERGGEGQAAPVVATVERRDQYDAQTREGARRQDRKSTRLNSSHTVISYAVFCLKKKKQPPMKKNIAELATTNTSTSGISTT